MTLDYTEIVRIANTKANELFVTEYNKVVIELERNVMECAKKGYFSTQVNVKTPHVVDVLSALQENYPGFGFYITPKVERSIPSNITCTWSPIDEKTEKSISIQTTDNITTG